MVFDWYCNKYHCKMLKEHCDARRHKAGVKRIGTALVGMHLRDAGCASCKQVESDFMEIVKKLCKHCGIEKPIEDMVRNKSCKHGLEALCKSCKKIRNSVKRAKPVDEDYGFNDLIRGDILFSCNNQYPPSEFKGTSPKMEDIDDWIVKPYKTETNDPMSCMVTLDFSIYPDILARIEKAAVDDFRTLEMQMIYMLSHMLSRMKEEYP